MKLSSLSTAVLDNAGVPFYPTHPATGQPITGMEFKIASKNSDAVRKRTRDFQKKMVTNRRYAMKNGAVDFEKIDEETTVATAMCIVGWQGVDDDDGHPIAHSFEEALKVVRSPGYSWLVEQIDKFASDSANFFVESVADSSNGPPKKSGEAAQPSLATPKTN